MRTTTNYTTPKCSTINPQGHMYVVLEDNVVKKSSRRGQITVGGYALVTYLEHCHRYLQISLLGVICTVC